MVDCFSRWTEIVRVPDTTASTVVDDVVDRLILLHDCPVQLQFDLGSQFLSGMVRRLSQRLHGY